MPDKFVVSTPTHIHSRQATARDIWSVFFALVPAGAAGVFIFGLAALKIIVLSLAACVLSEALIQKLMRRKVTVLDGSAALTGLLLAFNLSSTVPFWMPLVGGFFAIVIVKQAFGGLGANIFNPALAARAFLMASWPKDMTEFAMPFSVDTAASATPLTMLKQAKAGSLGELDLSYLDLFWGKRGGCIGEVCIIALLIAAAYLLYRRHIWWQTPVGFIITLGVLSWIFSAGGFFKGDFLFSILSGGLILGAFFMATDYVTSPLTKHGQLIFGIGCGLIAFVIRHFGGYPEGVSYAILIGNGFVPLIDRYLRPRIYGAK